MDSCHCKLTNLEHLREGEVSFSNLSASIPASHTIGRPHDLSIVLAWEFWLEMSANL